MQTSHQPSEKEQFKKTVTEDSIPIYKSKFCEYGSESLDQIWNHKLDEHTGQSINFNNMDKVDTNKLLFKLLAEQNNAVLEEVLSMKKAMKKILGQLIDDFEDGQKLENMTRKQPKSCKTSIKR